MAKAEKEAADLEQQKMRLRLQQIEDANRQLRAEMATMQQNKPNPFTQTAQLPGVVAEMSSNELSPALGLFTGNCRWQPTERRLLLMGLCLWLWGGGGKQPGRDRATKEKNLTRPGPQRP